MDQVLIDPSPETLQSVLNEAILEINWKCKARKIESFDTSFVFLKSSGFKEVNGGGVANNYSHTSSTSQAGIAFWTDVWGTKHIRVVSRRKSIGGRTVPKIFKDKYPPFVNVYPAQSRKVAKNKNGWHFDCPSCKETVYLEQIANCWDGVVCFVCLERRKYYEATGFEIPGGKL